MQPVKLLTRNGELVTYGSVPPFMIGKEAEVLLWGSRVFSLEYDKKGEPSYDVSGHLVYRESFAVALIITG